jgi:hypothetical protein
MKISILFLLKSVLNQGKCMKRTPFDALRIRGITAKITFKSNTGVRLFKYGFDRA